MSSVWVVLRHLNDCQVGQLEILVWRSEESWARDLNSLPVLVVINAGGEHETTWVQHLE